MASYSSSSSSSSSCSSSSSSPLLDVVIGGQGGLGVDQSCPYSCTFCGKVYTTSQALAGHYAIHNDLSDDIYILYGPPGSRIRIGTKKAAKTGQVYQRKGKAGNLEYTEQDGLGRETSQTCLVESIETFIGFPSRDTYGIEPSKPLITHQFMEKGPNTNLKAPSGLLVRNIRGLGPNSSSPLDSMIITKVAGPGARRRYGAPKLGEKKEKSKDKKTEVVLPKRYKLPFQNLDFPCYQSKDKKIKEEY